MFNAFFSNIGRKIKIVTLVFFVITCVTFFIGALIMFAEGEVGYGFLIALIGPFTAWLASLGMYGFGELIEATSDNRKLLASIDHKMSDNKHYLSAIAANTSHAKQSTVTSKPSVITPIVAQPAAAPAPAKPAPAKPVNNTTESEPSKPAVTSINPLPVIKDAAQESPDKEQLYLYAIQMLEKRNYKLAYNVFTKIRNYKNANDYLEYLKTLI